LYANKLKAVTGLGRILIPASELERVLSLAEPYNPKPKADANLNAESKPEIDQQETGQAS
jgi:hypothetical protein